MNLLILAIVYVSGAAASLALSLRTLRTMKAHYDLPDRVDRWDFGVIAFTVVTSWCGLLGLLSHRAINRDIYGRVAS